jgi:predicted transcriptional regulator
LNDAHKIGFGESPGETVGVTEFDLAAVDRGAALEDLQEALDNARGKVSSLLAGIVEALVSENLTAEQIKKRVFYFGYIAGRRPFTSQLELAKWLGISPAAVNQGIKDFCDNYPMMARIREGVNEVIKRQSG